MQVRCSRLETLGVEREREGGGGWGWGGFENNGSSGEISDQTPMRRCVDPHTGQDSAGAGLAYS